jgi:hypothetical protein
MKRRVVGSAMVALAIVTGSSLAHPGAALAASQTAKPNDKLVKVNVTFNLPAPLRRKPMVVPIVLPGPVAINVVGIWVNCCPNQPPEPGGAK